MEKPLIPSHAELLMEQEDALADLMREMYPKYRVGCSRPGCKCNGQRGELLTQAN